MDRRGQGGRWSTGATGDPAASGTGPENAAVMTRGITRAEDYPFSGPEVPASHTERQIQHLRKVHPPE